MKFPTGTPQINEFDPNKVPWQIQALSKIRGEFDYDQGVHEILFSGSVGSAKSILLAHMAVTHCLFNPGARVCLGRRALQDLKDTLFRDIVDHIGESLVRGKQWDWTMHPARIWFANGSEMICRTWADGNWTKFRSLKLSMGIVEELTENDDIGFYKEFRARVGRLPHIKETMMLCASNPGDPEHWAYKYWSIGAPESRKKTRHVFYSVSTDNPFLPPWYIEQLKDTYTEREARRMLYGEWIELQREVVYYAYQRERNFRDRSYEIRTHLPYRLCFDFNIAKEKPLSVAHAQYIPSGGDEGWHVFDETVIMGARTQEALEEIAAKGVFDQYDEFIVHGDAAGKHRDTRSLWSDYEIIENFLQKYKRADGRHVNYAVQLPRFNPPIKRRHNLVNGACHNANGRSRFWIYKDAPTADEGMRLVKLKEGAQYLEDDSKPYQHITTAIGYAVVYNEDNRAVRRSTTVRL